MPANISRVRRKIRRMKPDQYADARYNLVMLVVLVCSRGILYLGRERANGTQLQRGHEREKNISNRLSSGHTIIANMSESLFHLRVNDNGTTL